MGKCFGYSKTSLRGKALFERSLLRGSSTDLMMSQSTERGANV